MNNKRIIVPFLAAVIALLSLFILLQNHQKECPWCADLSIFSPALLKHFILGFGPWALIIFILLYAVNTVSILPPIGIMSLTAGFVFGPGWGSVALMAGSFLGTSATFFISRKFGQQFVDQLIHGKAKEIQEKLNKNGFQVILFMRLIPLIPWEMINYASGLSSIKYRDYILGTLIGILPAVVIQTFFSDSLAHFNIRDPKFIAAVSGFILLLLLPVIYQLLKSQRKMKRVGPADELVFVYQADSGFFAVISDFTHKIFSPETYQCHLCKLTHGNLTMKKDWREFLSSLPQKKVFLHQDEFFKKYPDCRHIRLPAILVSRAGQLRLLVSAEEIQQQKDVEALKNLTQLKIDMNLNKSF